MATDFISTTCGHEIAQDATIITIMKLTRKQKAFADKLIEHPKMSATQALRETYDIKQEGSTARTMAAQNLAKPSIQVYLEQHVDKAKLRVITLVDSEKEEIALRASEAVLDRALGKATQRTESVSVSLNFGMDLSGVTTPQD